MQTPVIKPVTLLSRALLHAGTPRVTVCAGPAGQASDRRRPVVRIIDFCRRPGAPDVTRTLVTRHRHDARGFLAHSADPRLHKAGLANFTYFTGLAGSVLRTQGADSGTTISLRDVAGRPVIRVSSISIAADGTDDQSQAVTRTWRYEDAALPGRPLSVTEQAAGDAARVTEHFVYAGGGDAEKARNLAGALMQHYDTAGLVHTGRVALTGVPLCATRLLLAGEDGLGMVSDWQGGEPSAWQSRLGGEAYTTLTTADAAGAVLATIDARGNRQRMAYDVAGRPRSNRLKLKGGAEQIIVASLTYSAAGQKLREAHGNGAVTTYAYDVSTHRLTGIKTIRPAGHASGAKVLQNLRCGYDPAGNVLKVSNDAEATRFWRNRKVVPENTYVYDSLYQLVSASGREMADAGREGAVLPPAIPLPACGSAYTCYTRTCTYDDGGNLTQVHHSAPATGNSYTTKITVSDRSNRGVLSMLTESAADVDALFTAGGQQKTLLPGQCLAWTSRSELLKVAPVRRDGGVDDRESYRYDGKGQRILKVSVQRAGSVARTQRVIYLPGLELRSTTGGNARTEFLQVISAGGTGRGQVRVLHRESGKAGSTVSVQVRYGCDSLSGSSGLELDGDGRVISIEEYYPYGGTAVWAARSAVEADDKTVRYSGKERDATGLYSYRYRYYQPWAGRWLSVDPAGAVDGLNLFRMCRNNPVTNKDVSGLIGISVNSSTDIESSYRGEHDDSVHEGGDFFTLNHSQSNETNNDESKSRRAVRRLSNMAIMDGRRKVLNWDHNVIFTEKLKSGAKRITIIGHGVPDKYIFGIKIEDAQLNFFGRWINPSELAGALMNNPVIAKELPTVNKIRLLMCHSADGGSDSFAAKFAQAIGKEVKGYEGKVWVGAWDSSGANFFDVVKPVSRQELSPSEKSMIFDNNSTFQDSLTIEVNKETMSSYWGFKKEPYMPRRFCPDGKSASFTV